MIDWENDNNTSQVVPNTMLYTYIYIYIYVYIIVIHIIIIIIIIIYIVLFCYCAISWHVLHLLVNNNRYHTVYL